MKKLMFFYVFIFQRDELAPLEDSRKMLAEQAEKRSGNLTWLGLGLMSVQFGILARLTWWEYSWDIMEPGNKSLQYFIIQTIYYKYSFKTFYYTYQSIISTVCKNFPQFSVSPKKNFTLHVEVYLPKSREQQIVSVSSTSKDFQKAYEGEILFLYAVTFGPNVPKLNSRPRPVYCS